VKRKTKDERRKIKYFNLKRLISLNRMVEGELSYQVNDSLYAAVAKLEKKSPGLGEEWARA